MQRSTLKESTQTRLQVGKSDVVRGGFTLTELLIVMAILVLLGLGVRLKIKDSL